MNLGPFNVKFQKKSQPIPQARGISHPPKRKKGIKPTVMGIVSVSPIQKKKTATGEAAGNIGFPLFLFQVDRQWSEVLAPMDVHFGGLEVSGTVFRRRIFFSVSGGGGCFSRGRKHERFVFDTKTCGRFH